MATTSMGLRLLGFSIAFAAASSSIAGQPHSVRGTPEVIDLDKVALDEARSEEEDDGVEIKRVRFEDKACKSIPLSMRQFFYDKLERATVQMNSRQKEEAAERFAKVLGMAVKESSGNATSITDMKLRGSLKSIKLFFAENKGLANGSMLQATLRMRDTLLGMSDIAWNKMTNFGLLQMSADRLTLGASNVELFNRYRNLMMTSPRAALEKCGTQYLYKDSAERLLEEIKEAAECRSGVQNVSEVKCFAKMVTICPSLNVELALNAPSAYFATRRAPSRCTEALKEVAGVR